MSDITDLDLKNYELVATEDGSYTIYSKLYGEACHSTSGARQETIKHYIEGCQIQKNSLKFLPIQILEVGFGVGIGFEETLKAIGKQLGQPFHFVSLEIDEELILFLKNKITSIQQLKVKHKFEHGKQYQLKTELFTLDILVGDARKTLPWFLDQNTLSFHAIYQDAFSPKRNATLWTYEWFKLLRSTCHKQAIMSTYSSSSSIRKAMIKAGWRVYKGEKFGPKRSSTRARLTGHSDPEILSHLERSPAILLTDSNANEYKLAPKMEKTHEKK